MSGNSVRFIGYIWMPSHILCAQDKGVTEYDIECMQPGHIMPLCTEDMEQWLMVHSGDFSHVVDWAASINGTEYPWKHEESEYTYNDCMYGGEAC